MNKSKIYYLANFIICIILMTSSGLYCALDLDKWTQRIDKNIDEKINSEYKTKNKKSEAKNYKLLFVYSSSCKYCHQFAPVLRIFADSNNIEMTSATVDGGVIAGFEDAQYVPDITQILNIKAFPTVLLLKNNSDESYVVSQGYVSSSQLSNNIANLGFEI
ncbi:MAG: conjugal transfer protein TraF [Rickettsiaceae bacterium]|nr:conjugal transfer protein TraF [Rickettsiaceae bacterium]